MSIKDKMLEQLEIARRIVIDGHENVAAWRIQTPDGAWLILTRFDPDKPGAVRSGPSDPGFTLCPEDVDRVAEKEAGHPEWTG